MISFARRERLALCDTALRVGPDAPTLCDPWDTRMLVCHLLVRERHPIAASGITVGALEGLTRHAMDELARGDFGRLVEQFRTPGVVVPFGWPGVEQVVNRLEHFIHHEDIRRAAPSWTPRTLDEADESSIWTALKVLGRALVRPAGVPVRMEWASRSATLRGGEDPVVLSGLPSELALALHGRARAAHARTTVRLRPSPGWVGPTSAAEENLRKSARTPLRSALPSTVRPYPPKAHGCTNGARALHAGAVPGFSEPVPDAPGCRREAGTAGAEPRQMPACSTPVLWA